MLILFDHGTPRGIARALDHHTVREARAQGWDTLKNGELLKAAEDAGFGVLLTTDKNLPYQQNLAGRKIAVVVLARLVGVSLSRCLRRLWQQLRLRSRERAVLWRSRISVGQNNNPNDKILGSVPVPADGNVWQDEPAAVGVDRSVVDLARQPEVKKYFRPAAAPPAS